MFTKHAQIRIQQRGIKTQILEFLLDYGDEVYDGHGGIIRFFSKKSLFNLKTDFGESFLKKFAEQFRCYLVESHDGTIITVGKRYHHKKAFKV